MPLNLFKDDFTLLTGSALHPEIETLLQLSEPTDSRPQESFQLDYKTEWGDSALKTVAAFANTLGGLLFVGVEEEELRPVAMPGVRSAREEKTRIASSIAANISPTPSFDIAECALPSDPGKRVAVVRVRPSPALYLLARGENPIYVRNGPESRPANVAQVRYLMERTRDPDRNVKEMPLRVELLRSNLGITEARGSGDEQEQKKRGRQQSSTVLSIMLLPSEALKLVLDRSLEGIFRTLILRRYHAFSRLCGVGSQPRAKLAGEISLYTGGCIRTSITRWRGPSLPPETSHWPLRFDPRNPATPDMPLGASVTLPLTCSSPSIWPVRTGTELDIGAMHSSSQT